VSNIFIKKPTGERRKCSGYLPLRRIIDFKFRKGDLNYINRGEKILTLKIIIFNNKIKPLS